MPSWIPAETSNEYQMKYHKSFPGTWLVQVCFLAFPQTLICRVFADGSWSTGQSHVITHSVFSVPPCKTGTSLPERVVKNTLMKISNKQTKKTLQYIKFPWTVFAVVLELYLSGEVIAVPLTARKSDLIRFGPQQGERWRIFPVKGCRIE